jgi:hypothetical protein
VFVADDSSKSTQIVRYTYDPVKDSLTGALPITVPNTNFAGGGAQGGRNISVALAPNGTDMYVAYIKSSDVAKLKDPMLITSGSPPACASATSGQCYTITGGTSDGKKGVNSMVMLKNDLYLAEAGGPSLTMIADPSGLAGRPMCTSTSKCTAIIPPKLPSGIPSFPGGMATDGTYLYVGDAPLNGTTGIGIVRWNVATGEVITLSQNIGSSYSGTVDGTTFKTYQQYASPIGIGVAANGDVYVADDPSFTCAPPTCPATPPTTQGHVWLVPFIPAAPTITSITPNTGVPQGGTPVTIQGTGFSTKAGVTSVAFGTAQVVTTVTCASVTQCSAVSPGGTGTVDVVVTVAGQSSPKTSDDTFTYQPVTVTGITPNSGSNTGGYNVTIAGTGFSTDSTHPSVVKFGTVNATSVVCSSPTTCTAAAPPFSGTGTVDVTVTVPAGTSSQTSNASAADQFTFVAQSTLPTVSSVCGFLGAVPSSCTNRTGSAAGGTSILITGTSLSNTTAINIGATPASSFTCAADGFSCTAVTAASTPAVVDVRVTAGGQTSLATPSDQFTYANPSATVHAFGITAPKGGMVWIPKNGGGGHWWSSDHANGFCRQDAISNATAPFALNYGVCDDGSIGSPGQAVYDSRTATCPAGASGPCHYIYVPDNAVKSVAVWRLTFDSATESIVGTPEGMIPLANVRTLKPNGMALGPDGSLYITDLTELNIRRVDGPNGDPRLQTMTIIGTTGDARGANGTVGFIGNKLYVSENRAASWLDITKCIDNASVPCSTAAGSSSTVSGITGFIPLPGGAFVAGVATDAIHGLVYAADSPGGSPATIWRYNVATGAASSVYLTSGTAPTFTASGSFNCALTCNRPVDGIAASNTFSFAFGLVTDPNTGDLFITEDATAGARSGRGRAWRSPFLP